jgi:purine-binding chemotaxis protein CheW
MPLKKETESYLTFKLDEEVFAINVAKVLEILEIMPITKVPKSPPFMRGVINLRGNILPVVDTRTKFGMSEAIFTIDTCIIVLSIESGNETTLIGAIVDSVLKVIDLSADSIQPALSMGVIYKEEFITAMGKADKDFIMILNIDKVFSVDEVLLPALEN